MFFNDNDSVFMFIKEILFEKKLTYYVLGLQSSWKNHTVSKEIICPGKPCYACLCRVQIQFMGTKTACNTVEYIWQFENVRLDLLSSDSALWLLQSILNEHGDCSSFVKKSCWLLNCMSLELLKNQCKVIGNETENQGKKARKS